MESTAKSSAPLWAAITISALLAIVFLSIRSSAQDRYQFDRPLAPANGDLTYYNCAAAHVELGNTRIIAFKDAWEDSIANAEYNKEALEPFYVTPGYTGSNPILKKVAPIINIVTTAVDLINSLAEDFDEYYYNKYHKQGIIDYLNDFYEGRVRSEDSFLQRVTERCAREQNAANKAYDERWRSNDGYSYSYSIGFTGVNNWMAYPIRIRTKVTVIECEGDQCEDGG